MKPHLVPGPFIILAPHHLPRHLEVLTFPVPDLQYSSKSTCGMDSPGGFPVSRSTGKLISQLYIRRDGKNPIASWATTRYAISMQRDPLIPIVLVLAILSLLGDVCSVESLPYTVILGLQRSGTGLFHKDGV